MAKLTPNQQAYLKQLNRIKRFYKSAEKRGFRFDEKISTELPKRVTKKSLEKITQTKPKQLYKTASYLDPYSGKLYTGEEGRTIERRSAYYKGKDNIQAIKDFTTNYSPPDIVDMIVENANEMLSKIDTTSLEEAERKLSEWSPELPWSAQFATLKEKDVEEVSTLLQGAISQLGREVVALNISTKSTEFFNNLEAILYGASGDKKDGIQPNLIVIRNILYNSIASPQEAIDLMERMDSVWDDVRNIEDYDIYERYDDE